VLQETVLPIEEKKRVSTNIKAVIEVNDEEGDLLLGKNGINKEKIAQEVVSSKEMNRIELSLGNSLSIETIITSIDPPGTKYKKKNNVWRRIPFEPTGRKYKRDNEEKEAVTVKRIKEQAAYQAQTESTGSTHT